MSARIVALLDLADELPELDELRPYLTDPDPEVRRTALSVLSESAEDWAKGSPWVARALLDEHEQVRATAIDLLAELREVLVAGPEFVEELRRAGEHPRASVRVAALGALWRHHQVDAETAARHLGDPEPVVRAEAVQALASLDDRDRLDDAAADPDAEVRAAVARGLGTLAEPAGARTLLRLVDDAERPVVVAALTALGRTGCPAEAATIAVRRLRDPYWQVREAAAIALAAADPDAAAGPLTAAAHDDNIDVRKAAVRGLAPWAGQRPAVAATLRAAADDPDADVRAHAREGLLEPTTREAAPWPR